MTTTSKRRRAGRRTLLGLAVATCLLATARAEGGGRPAAPASAALEACAELRVDAERLACYDGLMAPGRRGAAAAASAAAMRPPVAAGAAAPASSVAAAGAATAPVEDRSALLDEFWELSPERKRGLFNFTGYRPNYFLPLHLSSHLNRNPRSPSVGHDGALPDYRDLEAKLQLSVRTKLLEDQGLPGGDLWFAYTQQSLWQLYSGAISRPFRATDHEPELVYVVPTRIELPLGWKWQMAGIGLAHQSNGQALPFSRSWNRTYAMAGFEHDEFALTARYNKRIHESDGNDDNPDLGEYRGRSELLGVWSPGQMTASLLWKTNFNLHRGSLQFDWTMPVSRKDPKGLRWYAQVFTGYGEMLIDYNFRQTSVGAGVTLFGW
ncbi:MAG: phospholipase A [Caldimonas sp.]